MKYYGHILAGHLIQAWVVHESFLEKATSKLRPGGHDIGKKRERMLSVANECNIWKNGSMVLKCKQ